PKILFLSSFSSYRLNKWAESVPATAWTIITHSGKRKKSADCNQTDSILFLFNLEELNNCHNTLINKDKGNGVTNIETGHQWVSHHD
ncbi:MAG: hypothetical protein Q617_SPSC00011G0006, partial [Streptococcus sp. DORA_10]